MVIFVRFNPKYPRFFSGYLSDSNVVLGFVNFQRKPWVFWYLNLLNFPAATYDDEMICIEAEFFFPFFFFLPFVNWVLKLLISRICIS